MQKRKRQLGKLLAIVLVSAFVISTTIPAFAETDARPSKTLCNFTFITNLIRKNAKQISALTTEKDDIIYENRICVDQSKFTKSTIDLPENTINKLNNDINNLLKNNESGWVYANDVSKDEYKTYYKATLSEEITEFAPIESWVKSMTANQFDKFYSEENGIFLHEDRISYLIGKSEKNRVLAEEACKEINIDPNESDKEKINKILDYIINKVHYRKKYNYAESVFKTNKANCNAYAEAFYDMCVVNGIDCKIVLGYAQKNNEKEFHAWNAVKIDGEYYFTDPCWADSLTGKNTEYTLSKTLWENHEITEYIP